MSRVTVADDSFDLTYRLTRADLAAWMGLRRELSGLAKLAVLAPMIAVGAAFGYLQDTETGLAIGLGQTWVRYTVVFGAALALYAFVALFMSLVRARAIRLAAVPPGELHLVAGRAGLRLTHGGRTIAYDWNEILAVTLGKAHVFLATGPKDAIIVPQSAFEDAEHLLRFAVFADDAMTAAEARAEAAGQVVQRAGKR